MRKDLMYTDVSADAIYICSGLGNVIIDSFTHSTSQSNDSIAFDGYSIFLRNGATINLMIMSGISKIVAYSFSFISTAGGGSDITFTGVNIASWDVVGGQDGLYTQSGVSKIVTNSYPLPSHIDNITHLDYDGRGIILANQASKKGIFLFSGVGATVFNSFTFDSLDYSPNKVLAFDGDHKYAVGSTHKNGVFVYSGFSSQNVIDSFSFPNAGSSNIQGSAFMTTISSSDCISLNNGNILSVYNSGQGISAYDVKSKVFAVSTQTWGSEVAVDSNNTGYTHPAVVQLASDASIPNRILLAFRDKAADTINIFKSDDNGTSYTSLTTISIVLEENDRIGLARSGNNILITYHRGRTSYSRKSTDNGVTWGSEVTLASDALYPDISVLDTGSFIAAIETYDIPNNIYGRVYTYSSVDGSSWAQTSITVMNEATNRYTRPAIVIDDTGLITVIAQNKVTKDLAITRTSGVTTTSWGAINSINPLPDQGSSSPDAYNKGLFAPSACIHEGRIFVQAEAWDGVNGHMTAFKTQNWRNVNETKGFSYYYYPIMGLPDVIGGWTFTNSDGTTSESGGILNLVTTGGSDNHSYTKSDIGDTRGTEAFTINFILSCDNDSDRIYKHSGFSDVILDSFGSPGPIPIGVAWDGTNFISSDGNIGRIFKHSGFSDVILDSFDSPGGSTGEVAWDGTNILSCSNTSDRIYKHSGFSDVILDSFDSPGPTPIGVVWDGTDVISSDNNTLKIYKHSGFSDVILDSFDSPGPIPIGVAWDGTDVISSDNNTLKIYKHSGFSDVILDSFGSPGGSPRGLFTATDFVEAVPSTGMKLKFKVKMNSGGSVTADDTLFTIILSDGTNDVKVKIRLATTGFRFIDENDSNATIADVSHALTEHHEFLIAMKNNDLSAWYRKTHDNEIKWMNIVDNYQVDATGVETSSSIEFGVLTATADIDIYDIGYEMNDDGLSDGFTNPDDLVPRFTATGSKPQHLLEGIDVIWGGSGGVVNDLWTIKSAFTFPKEDLITDSPSDFVRTENDNVQHVYTFDAGENKVFNVDQMNLVGSNFRTGSIQMNATDSWGSPTLDQTFTVASEISGSVTSVTENTLIDSSLSLRLNQLARPNRPMYLRMTSGTANGFTYAIESNMGTLIKTTNATLVTDGVSGSDTYVVFIDRITQQVTSTNLRYMRLVIDAQHTADDYYKIGKFIAGIRLDMSKNFNSKYKFKITPNININKSSRAGQKFTVKRGESKQTWDVTFSHATSAVTKEFEEFFEAIDWANNPFVFINDSANLQDFILGRIANVYLKDHIITDIYNVNKFSVEEEL